MKLTDRVCFPFIILISIEVNTDPRNYTTYSYLVTLIHNVSVFRLHGDRIRQQINRMDRSGHRIRQLGRIRQLFTSQRYASIAVTD